MPYLGEIRLFPYEFVPLDWAACDGSVLQIAQHPALFSLLQSAYGGDGQSNFALPNICVPFQPGQNQGHYCIAVRGVYPDRG
jgi:microcystin-dependent protein